MYTLRNVIGTLESVAIRTIISDVKLISKCRFVTSIKPEQEENEKRHCNIGTIGHVDHGKTTLTAAITKVLSKDGLCKFISYNEIDRAAEEKARGITINAAHIGYRTKNRHYAHTDCPGHADYIKNMISGTSQMDAAILVVAATDGTMPQTREHLLLAKQIGVEKIIVFINKCDLVDKEIMDLVELEVREMLMDFGFDSDCPVIFGSALQALEGNQSIFGEESIKELLNKIDSYVPNPKRDYVSPFLVPIDSAFTAVGRGTVVVGTIKRGIIHKNDEANLTGYDTFLKTSIGDIHIFKNSVTKAKAGDNVGLLLRQIKINSIRKGMLLCAAGSLIPTNHFKATIYFLSRSEGGRKKPILNGYIQQLMSQTWNIECRIDSIESDIIMPGEHAQCKVTLLKRMTVMQGQGFTIRENNVTVASGKIIEILESIEIPKQKLSKTKINKD